MPAGLRVTGVFELVTLRTVAFRHTSPGRDPLSGSGAQQLGEVVALAGLPGLRAPSATGLGHVIVFFEAHIPRDRVYVLKTEQLALYL